MAKLVVALLVIGAASLLLTLLTQVSVLVVRRRRTRELPRFSLSVLKPLKGADPELFENLVSFARQDHPSFELILGAEDPLDRALPIARRLMREFPEVAIRVVCGGRPIGLNPKVNNLAHLARVARHDHVLISDADVRVAPDYLRAMSSEMADPRVGLVSSVIAAASGGTLAASLESLHVNTFIARSVCGAEVLSGHACVIGKSMLFRWSDLERLGGLDVVKDVLAEDYVLGQVFRDGGHRVALSPHAVRTVNAPRPPRELAARHVRWSQMRRHLAPRLYWGEPIMMPAVWLTIVLLAMYLDPLAGGGAARVIANSAAAGLVALGLADALLVRELTGESFDAKWVFLGPLRDFTALLVWLAGALRRTVVWRGNAFAIGRGSVLTPLDAPEASAELGTDDRDVAALEV
ncbi:MAG TPA: ceramide glucosyltransferase [Polyangiaceae bacterium]|jgi:ceramide glucosyltransferase|nr:ceramide glucosyltransferase [Polyangiaceae bacterium]